MIHELDKASREKARPLFQEMGHNQIFIDALFEGNHTGRIFVDNRVHPSAALAALACDFFCPAGRTDNLAFNSAIRVRILTELVHAEGDLLLSPPSSAWQSALEKLFGDFRLLHVTRKTFTFVPERYQAKCTGWQMRIPEGYTIQRYDHRLAEGIGLAAFWGSLDNFLRHGVGFAILRGEEVISRCHTVMVGNGKADISIETAKPYQRRGFATLAACAFIDYCKENGLHPAWSCWDNNIASQILAQKLGFNHPADFPVIYAKVKSFHPSQNHRR